MHHFHRGAGSQAEFFQPMHFVRSPHKLTDPSGLTDSQEVEGKEVEHGGR